MANDTRSVDQLRQQVDSLLAQNKRLEEMVREEHRRRDRGDRCSCTVCSNVRMREMGGA